MVDNGTFSQNLRRFLILKGIKIALLVHRLRWFYWMSGFWLLVELQRWRVCAAGLFLCKGTFFSFNCIPVVLHESFFVCFDGVLEGNWQLEFCQAGALDPQLVGLRPVVFVEVGWLNAIPNFNLFSYIRPFNKLLSSVSLIRLAQRFEWYDSRGKGKINFATDSKPCVY